MSSGMGLVRRLITIKAKPFFHWVYCPVHRNNNKLPRRQVKKKKTQKQENYQLINKKLSRTNNKRNA